MENSGTKARPDPAGLLGDLVSRVRSRIGDPSDRATAQRSAGWTFLLRVANAGIAFGSQILLARWMGAHEFGIYVYVWSWVLLLGGIGTFGLAMAPPRFVPEYAKRGDLDGLRGFLVGSRVQAFLTATAIGVAGLLGLYLFGDQIESFELVPLYLACVCLPMYALTEVQDGIGRSYDWIDIALAPPYLIRPLMLLSLMAAMYLAGIAPTAVSAMLASIVATWVTALLQLWALNRRLRTKVPRGPARFEPKTWAVIAFPIFIVDGFHLLLGHSDVLILSQFVPPEEVSVYWGAIKLMSLAVFVSFSVSAGVSHRFTEYGVTGDRLALAGIVRDAVRWTFWPTLAAVIFLLAVGYPALRLFGPDFVAGYPLMFVLAIGILARASIGPVERLLNMLGEQKICAAAYAVTFAISLGLALILIPRLGTAGMAWAMSIALIVESFLLFWVTRRRLGLHVFFWGGPPDLETAAKRVRLPNRSAPGQATDADMREPEA
jgi:O-antigen/teichoic acid export membrane protein